jgi:small-conductance mechanosensitive channel/CRP-like cAMP-binding protein
MSKRFEKLWPVGLFALFALGAVFASELLAAVDLRRGQRAADVVAYGLQIGVWLSGAYLIVRVLNHYVWDHVVAPSLGTHVPRLLRECVAVIVGLLALAGILGVVFDQSVAGLWATSGAITIILGLALRTIILDVFTGLAVNVEGSYRIGDWIEIFERDRAVYGQVVEIGWRTTRIDGADGRTTIVPNSRMGTIQITNYSMPDGVSRFEVPFVLDFSIPQERATRILLAGALEACAEHRALVEHPEPRVIVHGPTGLGVEYRVRYWCRVADVNPPMARDAVCRAVLHHIERAGVTLAYPKLDMYHAEMPVRHLQHHAEADRAKLLAGIDIFAQTLTDAERQTLAHEIAPRRFAAGTQILRAAEPGASMFVLAEGLLEVSAQIGSERVRLAFSKPGQFVGEMSLLTGEPRSADVVAATESLAYEITREHLLPLFEARPELIEAIGVVVAERRQGTERRLAESASTPAADARGARHQLVRKMRLFFGRVFERPAASGGQ